MSSDCLEGWHVSEESFANLKDQLLNAKKVKRHVITCSGNV